MKDVMSFRIDPDKRQSLDAVAKSLERDRSYVINAALESFLDLYHWQVSETRQAIVEADSGNFASVIEIETVFEELGTV